MTKERYKIKEGETGNFSIVYGKMELVVAYVPAYLHNDKAIANEIVNRLNESFLEDPGKSGLIPRI